MFLPPLPLSPPCPSLLQSSDDQQSFCMLGGVASLLRLLLLLTDPSPGKPKKTLSERQA